MNSSTERSPFYKSLMAGLSAGIVLTISNLIFSAIYRSITQFNLSWVVNIETIIFFSILFSLVAGLVFYLIVPYGKRSKVIYSALFIVLMIAAVIGAYNIHRSNDATVSAQFHGLVAGIFIITGLVDAFLIPYMSTHKNPMF